MATFFSYRKIVKFFNIFVYFCSEHEFFDEDSNYTAFYTAFGALAADKLSQCKLGMYYTKDFLFFEHKG